MRVDVVPLVGESDFEKSRRGTKIRRSDVRKVYGGQVIEAILPSGDKLFHLLPNSLQESSQKQLLDSFAKAALMGESNRKGVIKDDTRVQRGSLLAGAFDARDIKANQSLKKQAKRKIPLTPGGVVCRTTPFSIQNPKKWNDAMPVINEINRTLFSKVRHRSETRTRGLDFLLRKRMPW